MSERAPICCGYWTYGPTAYIDFRIFPQGLSPRCHRFGTPSSRAAAFFRNDRCPEVFLSPQDSRETACQAIGRLPRSPRTRPYGSRSYASRRHCALRTTAGSLASMRQVPFGPEAEGSLEAGGGRTGLRTSVGIHVIEGGRDWGSCDGGVLRNDAKA